MPQTLAQIEREIESLRREAERVRKSEMAGVIARIKEAIRHYELTPQDLGFRSANGATKRKGKKATVTQAASVRYQDPSSGRTWTGRGRRPQWFIDALAAGKSAQDLVTRP